mgnify:CR=1 FL=1
MMDQHAQPNRSVLPASPVELELLVQRTLHSFGGSPEQEKAIVYSRVSSIEPKGHSFSMDYQPDRSEEYARSKGWLVVASYADPDRTGRNSKRPGLQAMIRDIESGRATVIVVHRLDRLYRNLESLLRFMRFLRKHRVRLVSVTEQIDTESWWGRLVLYVLGALAEMHEDAATAVLAMQGTFYRAFSLVNGGREVETDLFAGLR